MKTSRWIKGLSAALAVLGWACAAGAEPLRVFAAASLQGPLDQLAESWNSEVRISYGGSGAIARQVGLGAPADVVMLANADWMAWLADRLPLAVAPRDVLGNRLVLIGPKGAKPLEQVTAAALEARLNGNRLAMGQHQSVPAGIYARQWLDRIGAWDRLHIQLAETENVRAALTLVTRGEVPLGIVYASDAAAAAGDITVIHHIPPDAHAPIRYPAAAITGRGIPFLTHLAANTDLFVAAGFTAPP
ncbi:MAG: molybdate ABC transporter substrate-binding protein [Pseudomonadota bacterium]